MRIYALCSALLGACLAATAIPAKPTPVTYTQPDGTELTVLLRGDERHHARLSEDGYLLVEKDGALYYGDVNAFGQSFPSDILARPAEQRDAQALDFLSRIDRAQTAQRLQTQRDRSPRMAAANGMMRTPGIGLFPGTAYPNLGSPKGLVILVQYSDKAFTLSDPLEYYGRFLHEPGFSDYGATGSAQQYFTDCSNGMFVPQFDVYGPVTLPQTLSYYGSNDWAGNDQHPEQLAIHACQALDDEVDFSQYDCDGDGYIDNVYLFYAGRGEASGGASNTIWPHSWEVTAATSTPYIFDGVRLDRYACSNEWETGAPDGIGTFCHEFSHVMGLPDLYATSYTSAFTPGEWSALDYGPYNNEGRTPPLYSIFERNSLNWCDPTEITGPCSAQLPAISNNVGFVINTDNPNEFFLFENRQKEGWDKYIPGHGMLVWHIDFNSSVWNSNTVNNSSSHQYVDLEEADNTHTEYSRDGDPFPGAAGITSFTDDTQPSMKTWAKKPLNLPITNIKEEDGMITFDVCGGGPVVVADNGIQPKVRMLYTPGDANGWNPAESQMLTTTDFVNFYGFARLDGEFKLTDRDDFSGNIYGAGEESGSIDWSADAPSLSVETPGLYWCHVNIEDFVYEATLIESIAAIGAFAEQDAAFAPDETCAIWSGYLALAPGDTWQLCCNGDSALVFGGSTSDFFLGGTPILASKRGNYSIAVDFSKRPYAATVDFERTYAFFELAPTILDPTEVADTALVANWEPMDGAVDYEVTLLTPSEDVGQWDCLDFSDGTKTLPNGWKSSSNLSYSTEGRYGEAAPSLRFPNAGGYLLSPRYSGDVRALSFWYKGFDVLPSNTLNVTIGDTTYVCPVDDGLDHIFSVDSIPAGVHQIKIEFAVEKRGGSMAVDDIKLLWGQNEILDVFDEYAAGDQTSLLIDNLQPLTDYVIYVVAVNAEGERSLPSNRVRITTIEKQENGIAAVVAPSAVWLDGRTLRSSGPAKVYTIDGRCLGNAPMRLEPGIYVAAPASSAPQKLIVR